jgi:hypothetical protein
MIQKGLAFRWQQSGSVAWLDEAAWPRYGILPRRHHCQCGASAVTARKAVSTEEGFEMKLTDTQLVLLSVSVISVFDGGLRALFDGWISVDRFPDATERAAVLAAVKDAARR